MLTSKARAYLRGIASTADTILQVGKEGVTDTVVSQLDMTLTAREIVKGRVLDNSLLSPREAGEALASACGAELVCAIGTKFVIYRESKKLPREKRIQLP